MRSEDLSGIPESIERWKVGELLEGLGFKPGSYKSVAEILIGPRQVVVHAYATNEDGRRYVVPGEEIEVQDLGDKDPHIVPGESKAAMHTISIPFVDGWEKPDRGATEAKPWPVGPDGKLLPPAASGTTNG